LFIKAITLPAWYTGAVGLPVVVVVLAGGLTTHFVWCLYLNIQNRTGYQYFHSQFRGETPAPSHILENVTDAPGEEMAAAIAVAANQPCVRPRSATISSPALRGTCSSSSTPWAKHTDGPIQIFKLDAAHGKHHHLQHAVGHRAQGMERHGQPHEVFGGPRPDRVDQLEPSSWVTATTWVRSDE
jgi:hypothetical protein